MANVFIDFIYRSKGAASVKKDLDGIQKSARRIEDTFTAIGKLGAAGLTVGVLVNFAKEANLAASQARATQQTFANLSVTSIEYAKNLEAMERATQGYVSETEQAQIANQLLGMEVATSAEELEKIVDSARRLGKEFKQLGAKQAAEEFAIMMSNASEARLDSFGLASARVSKRIKELQNATKGLTREEAFRIATLEELDRKIEQLGDETETQQDKISKLAAGWDDLKVTVGEFTTDGGTLDLAIQGLDFLNDTLTLGRGILALNQNTWRGYWNAIKEGDVTTKNIREEIEKLNKAFIEQNTIVPQANLGNRIDDLREQIRKDTPEQDERQLKRLANAERDALKELRDIDETFQQESTEAWDEYWTDLESLRNESAKRILGLERNFTKQIGRLTRNFNRDSERSAIRSARSIERIRKDAAKKIERLEQDQRRKQKERQLDTLQDERLFQFELRNLAADGEFLAIQEAIQRREIEKQIEQEKNREKEQEEQQSLNTRIDRIRQDAEDRIREEQAAARLAQQWRKEDFDARKAELEEQLKEEREAELASLNERELQLTAHYNEKLNLAMKSRDDALATLGAELTEMEGMTILRLSKIREAAESLGYESGSLFGQSFVDAINQFDIVSEALGQGRFTPGGRGGGGFGIGPGVSRSFGVPLRRQFGGLAPVGVPSLVGEAGPELITPMNTINVSPTVNVSGANEDMVNGIVNTHIQNLVNELEGALAT